MLYQQAIFHWLHTSERIKFKLAVLVYRALHGTAPGISLKNCYVADMPVRGRLWSSLLDVRPSRRATVYLPQLRVPGFGTVCDTV